MGTFGQNFWKRQRRPRRDFAQPAPPPSVQKTPQPIAVNDYKAKQQAEEIPQPLPRPDKAHII